MNAVFVNNRFSTLQRILDTFCKVKVGISQIQTDKEFIEEFRPQGSQSNGKYGNKMPSTMNIVLYKYVLFIMAIY